MNWKQSARAAIVTDRKIESNPDAFLAQQLNALLEDGRVKSRDFASSLLGGFAKYRRFTDRQRPYVEKLIREASEPRPVEAPKGPQALDLSQVPSGRYAVEQRRYQVDNVQSGKWMGWVFVKDGSEYAGEEGSAARRVGSQRPGGAFKFGQHPHKDDEPDLRKIAADPKSAAARYGQITGVCGRCGRTLENPESVAIGLGPICREGW